MWIKKYEIYESGRKHERFINIILRSPILSPLSGGTANPSTLMNEITMQGTIKFKIKNSVRRRR
jgi:hypothetical protein